MRTRITSRHWVSVLVLICLAGIWQILSVAYPVESLPGRPMVPGWQVLVTQTFKSFSDYWGGGLGVPSVADGAPPSYLAALLAIASNSWDTFIRVIAGWAVGVATGTLFGLAISWSSWARRVIDWPTQFLRMMPLLAMVPLFQLWFGYYFIGKVAFVAYGVGVLFFAGIINAVKNIPQIYIDNARSLGANRSTLYRTVVIPALLPELRGTVTLSLGIAWTAVIGSEYIGAQSGLGFIVVYSEQFAYLDRMLLVSLLIVIFTLLSYWPVNVVAKRLFEWMPTRKAGRNAQP
jgi:sulfonate transport system permease protein